MKKIHEELRVIRQQMEEDDLLHSERISAQNQSIERIDKAFARVQFDLRETRSVVSRLEDGYGKVETRLGKLESGLGKLESRLGKVESGFGKLKVDVTQLQTDVGELQADLGDVKGDVGVLKSDVSELTMDFSGLRANARILGETLETTSDSLGELMQREQC